MPGKGWNPGEIPSRCPKDGKNFKGFIAQQIERSKNTEVDELAKDGTMKAVLPLDAFFQVIEDPSIKTVEPEPRMINIIQETDWTAPIIAYLCHHYEPNSEAELIRMQQRAKAYQIIGDDLYKTLVIGPLLRRLSWDEGKELQAQIHSGVCGGHIGARALAVKVFW
jgi:hypothetical protein